MPCARALSNQIPCVINTTQHTTTHEMAMKTRHTHKTDWIQRAAPSKNAATAESVVNQVREVEDAQPRKWPVFPKAHSEEEEELKRYKCPKTKRAHRKAYRMKHRDVKSDSEASEECDDMTIGMRLH